MNIISLIKKIETTQILKFFFRSKIIKLKILTAECLPAVPLRRESGVQYNRSPLARGLLVRLLLCSYLFSYYFQI